MQRQARPEPDSGPAAEPQRPTVCIVGRCDVRLWGLSSAERLRRGFARAGIERCQAESEPLPQTGSVILIRADHVFEESLIKALAAATDVVLAAPRPNGGRVAVAGHVEASRAAEVAAVLRLGALAPKDGRLAGLAVLGPEEIGAAYNRALRKRAVPYVLPLSDDSVTAIEKRMFQGAYKGVTDFVTKWLWPTPARWATRWAAERGISPNAVTWASLVLVFVALFLFAAGHFLSGLTAAWVMTFLDTVDGKLARVTLTSSKAGDAFDHGIDLLHPPFWYAAWWYGLPGWPGLTPAVDAMLLPALWIIVAGYVAGRLIEGLFLWQFKLEIHAWRPVDSWFRLFTARRNPNLVLLTLGAIAGRPDIGFLAVAVWTLLSLLFHVVRLGQAAWRKPRGPLASWLAEPQRSPAP